MSVDLSLVERSGCDVVELLRDEAVSPHDLLDTLAAQIARVEPQVNTLPTLCFERPYAHADALLKKPVGERGLRVAVDGACARGDHRQLGEPQAAGALSVVAGTEEMNTVVLTGLTDGVATVPVEAPQRATE